MDGKLYCSVRITDIAYSADKGYAYMVPPSMRDTLHKGSVVLVPTTGEGYEATIAKRQAALKS